MTEIERLIEALLSDEGYVTGRRSFPGSVSKEEAATLSAIAQGEVDRGTQARAAAAERAGEKIACQRGCNACCCEMVLVYHGEAELVARWLEEPENQAAKAAFLERYPRWREAVGDAPQRLENLCAAGNRVAYETAHVEQARKAILCAFNVDGACGIYAVRPVNCRNAHAVETSAYCAGLVPGKPAQRLEYTPLDQFLERVDQLELAAHHALGGPRKRPEAIADAVMRRLR